MTKLVLVTGATKGIGFAISKLLNESGYTVIGIARNDIGNEFPGILFTVDLYDSKSTERLLIKIKQLYPKIRYIVNNAGIALPQTLGNIDINSLDLIFNLNVKTAIQVTQTFINEMKQDNFGKIINITSRAIYGAIGRSGYSAAKSALVSLTKTWALELAPYGINVNAVAPGPIDTELFRQTRPVGSQAEKEVLEQIPLGRLGKPEDIAKTVEFLLSDNANFITGQNINVNGGSSL